MSILDALKKLVVKRGGTPKGSNIAEVIDDLAETPSGGGDKLIVHVNAETHFLDKTWNEINTAFREGILTYIAEDSDENSYHTLSLVSAVSDYNSGGQNVYEVMSGSAGYTALSADDYPSAG